MVQPVRVQGLPLNLDTLKASPVSRDGEGTGGVAVLTEGEGGGREGEGTTRIVVL